ncbi:hypothetical protein HPB51_020034 [Rhipicephalus microplus]|uniref:Uncharacterized protein n=1 Tax=Rhipicephalus microplus TaxID=6941 RepID=A0A9J6DC59_RHIMP|nr:hypothetical protein HPB51_020034 [Rhipicephalus microplus]
MEQGYFAFGKASTVTNCSADLALLSGSSSKRRCWGVQCCLAHACRKEPWLVAAHQQWQLAPRQTSGPASLTWCPDARGGEAGEACKGDAEGVLSPGSPLGRALTRSTLMAQEEHAVHTRRPRVRVPVGAACGPCASNPSSGAAAAATERGAPHQRRADNLRRPNTTARALLLSRRRSWRKCVRRRLWKKKGALGKAAAQLCVSRGPRGGSSSLPVEGNLLGGFPLAGSSVTPTQECTRWGRRRGVQPTLPHRSRYTYLSRAQDPKAACAQVPAEVAALAGMQTKYVTVADVKRQEPESPCTSDAGRPRTTQMRLVCTHVHSRRARGQPAPLRKDADGRPLVLDGWGVCARSKGARLHRLGDPKCGSGPTPDG